MLDQVGPVAYGKPELWHGAGSQFLRELRRVTVIGLDTELGIAA